MRISNLKWILFSWNGLCPFVVKSARFHMKWLYQKTKKHMFLIESLPSSLFVLHSLPFTSSLKSIYFFSLATKQYAKYTQMRSLTKSPWQKKKNNQISLFSQVYKLFKWLMWFYLSLFFFLSSGDDENDEII